MKLTIIGAGNMGGALARGWYKSISTAGGRAFFAGASDICLTARTSSTLRRLQEACPGVRTSLRNAEAAGGADVIVLAVKPWLVESVVAEIAPALTPGRILCSVAAGIPTARLGALLQASSSGAPSSGELFYCMPNIAAEFGQSMTFIAPGSRASSAALERVQGLFRLVGQAEVCPEQLMGAGMTMAGCGIAYVMRFLRAQTEAGVEMGFRPAEALQIALQTMQGAVSLLRGTGLHPEAAIDRVTTPGGTTIRGLNELEHAGFTSAVIRCLKAGLSSH